MLVNRDGITEGIKNEPQIVAAPIVENVKKAVVPTRPMRLRVEEIEPRVAPNAIWGD